MVSHAAARLSCDPSPYPIPLCMAWSSSDHQTKTTRPPFPLSTRLSDWQIACDSSAWHGDPIHCLSRGQLGENNRWQQATGLSREWEEIRNHPWHRKSRMGKGRTVFVQDRVEDGLWRKSSGRRQRRKPFSCRNSSFDFNPLLGITQSKF